MAVTESQQKLLYIRHKKYANSAYKIHKKIRIMQVTVSLWRNRDFRPYRFIWEM